MLNTLEYSSIPYFYSCFLVLWEIKDMGRYVVIDDFNGIINLVVDPK